MRFEKMTKDEYTSIRVKVETRERLRKIGEKGDTYNVIIERLLEETKQ